MSLPDVVPAPRGMARQEQRRTLAKADRRTTKARRADGDAARFTNRQRATLRTSADRQLNAARPIDSTADSLSTRVSGRRAQVSTLEGPRQRDRPSTAHRAMRTRGTSPFPVPSRATATSGPSQRQTGIVRATRGRRRGQRRTDAFTHATIVRPALQRRRTPRLESASPRSPPQTVPHRQVALVRRSHPPFSLAFDTFMAIRRGAGCQRTLPWASADQTGEARHRDRSAFDTLSNAGKGSAALVRHFCSSRSRAELTRRGTSPPDWPAGAAARGAGARHCRRGPADGSRRRPPAGG